MTYWAPLINVSAPRLQAWRRKGEKSPMTVRGCTALSLSFIAIVTWTAVGVEPTSSFTALLNLAIVIAVLTGNLTGWGLAVILAAASLPYGASALPAGMVLVIYGALALPILLTPSAREWV